MIRMAAPFPAPTSSHPTKQIIHGPTLDDDIRQIPRGNISQGHNCCRECDLPRRGRHAVAGVDREVSRAIVAVGPPAPDGVSAALDTALLSLMDGRAPRWSVVMHHCLDLDMLLARASRYTTTVLPRCYVHIS